MCHPDLTQIIVDHYNKTWELPKIAANARASHVGKVKEGNYVLNYQKSKVCDAPAKDITEGLQYERKYSDPKRKFEEPKLPENINISETLEKLLSSKNIASRESVYERYDKTIQGIIVIGAGLADSGIIAPLIDEEDEDIKYTGVAVSVDGNARYGRISPYWQSANALCECLRNIASVGAIPQALTDCLNYGNPEKEEQMWELVEGIRGLKETAENIRLKNHPDFPTPYISGNVSLYNESKNGSINPSAIVACIGTMKDFRKAINTQFKQENSIIFLLGERKNECGGSEYYKMFNEYGKNIPRPDFEEVQNQIYTVTDAIEEELVLSAHDISEGGLAVTLAEMTMRGEIGFNINLSETGSVSDDKKMFTETGGFILEIDPKNKEKFLTTCNKYNIIPLEIGSTTKEPTGKFLENNKEVASLSLEIMKEKWHLSLRKKSTTKI